jgi:hypothetical protein
MTNLSPAAQAVMDAYLNAPLHVDFQMANRLGIASAIRAVADQVVPDKPEPLACLCDDKEEFTAVYNIWLNMRLARKKFHAIAAELGGQ